jgi:hypothetical protein
MMAALRAMGFAEDEPSAHALKMEVSPSPADKVSLQQEILAIKRSALAMKREGRSAEARDELRQAKILEQRLQTLQAGKFIYNLLAFQSLQFFQLISWVSLQEDAGLRL